MKKPFLPILLFILFVNQVEAVTVKQWQIAAGGNAFLVRPHREGAEGSDRWQQKDDYYITGFYANRDCDVTLVLDLVVPQGVSKFQLLHDSVSTTLSVSSGMERSTEIKLRLKQGYTTLKINGLERSGAIFAHFKGIVISSGTEGLELNYVKDNIDNRFYWGRRGPSVHLNYTLPPTGSIEYFYNELTVPVGMDPVGSYFMANGFGEGYFGMQVNSPGERRVLFSVWSPYKTDHPENIPEAERIILLAKGKGVHAGEFGNEGSGGQSYLKTFWKAGTTYGFLLKGTPDGQGHTIYTAWFHDPELGKWQLIASFQRPKTDHYLTRLHSFLENFADYNGYLSRKCLYGNGWCLDKEGNWFKLTQAKLTGDDIAKRGYRLDYAGGVAENHFFLQNGGFFNNSGCQLQSMHQLPK